MQPIWKQYLFYKMNNIETQNLIRIHDKKLKQENKTILQGLKELYVLKHHEEHAGKGRTAMVLAAAPS